MIKHFDTYFLDANKALEEAKNNNKVIGQNPRITFDQICYYNAEEELENAPTNCIYVPFENVYNYFITTKNRRPEKLNYDNTDISKEERKELTTSFTAILKLVEQEREALAQLYKEQIQNYKPNFNDEKLRVLIPANKNSTVMRHISKNVAKAFEQTGKYEVCYLIQEDDMQDMDYLIYYHKVDEFKPHITFNINHMNNEFLNEYVYNFIWFQDAVPVLIDDNEIYSRKNDYFFHLTEGIGELLKKKNIKSDYQSFLIDQDIYMQRDNIEREDKIIFIGSSYYSSFKNINNKYKEAILDIIKKEFFKHGQINKNLKTQLVKIFKIPFIELNHIINYVQRDIALEYLSDNLEYPIEIYGYDFEYSEKISAKYKGIIEYGEEISKTYNSSKYAIVLGGYALQQRTLEALASGCTPLILNTTNSHKEDAGLEKDLIFFNKIQDLPKLIENAPYKNTNSLLKQKNYSHLIEKIECIIKRELN